MLHVVYKNIQECLPVYFFRKKFCFISTMKHVMWLSSRTVTSCQFRATDTKITSSFVQSIDKYIKNKPESKIYTFFDSSVTHLILIHND